MMDNDLMAFGGIDWPSSIANRDSTMVECTFDANCV